MKPPNGYGSVYKLSGKRRKPYAARKTTGWKDNGQPTYEFIGYYATRKEALTALSDYNKDPYDIKTNTITFGEVYHMWYAANESKMTKDTISDYVRSFKLCDPIKEMKIIDIKLTHLQKLVDESGKNKPILKKLKTMFGAVWDYAVMNEIVTADKREMIRYIDIEKGNPNSIERIPFSKEEIENLWDLQRLDNYVSIPLIMIYTGVRISELLDLKKADVHLKERWFRVIEAKTKAGIRDVPIAEKIVPFFEEWLKMDSEYLVSEEGKHFTYQSYTDKYWKPLLDGKHRPHDTRHTCVSLLFC